MALPQKETLLEFRVNALVGAVNRLSDRATAGLLGLVDAIETSTSTTAIMEKIDRLTNILEKHMATQEERLQAVAASLDKVQAGVDRIQEDLEKLKNDNPALSDEIAAIEDKVSALGTDVAEAQSPSEPAPTEPSSTPA
jgi:septal ring factor EnvC (AmiA/AmiB activator)